MAAQAETAQSPPQNATTTITTTPSKRKPDTSKMHHQQPNLHLTARNPPWTYLKLQLVTQPPHITRANHSNADSNNDPLDPLTTRTYLTAALSQFLGLVGTSIPIDILKISSSPTSASSSSTTSTSAAPSTSQSQTQGNKNTVWIRVPRPDAAAVVVALSSWVGGGGGSSAGVAWRVLGKGNFLGAVCGGNGKDLFVP